MKKTISALTLIGLLSTTPALGEDLLLSTKDVQPNLIATQVEKPVPVLYEETGKEPKEAPSLINAQQSFSIYCEKNELEIQAQVLAEGKTLLPLKEVLVAFAYDFQWNNMSKGLEIYKGSQYTQINSGKNYYFQNKKAPRELSTAPILRNNHLWVPVEFLPEILNIGFTIDAGKIILSETEIGFQNGYIQEIEWQTNGSGKIILSRLKTSQNLEDQVIIHVEPENAIFNTELKKGEFVQVLTAAVMTASIPGQTQGYLFY